MKKSKISVGDNIEAKRGTWDFSYIEHNNFEQHVSKSVPGYKTGHEYITFLSDYFISPGSNVYDIGCSTGNLITMLSSYNKEKKNISFNGIEPVEEFEKEFKKNISSLKTKTDHEFNFFSSPIQDFVLENCDLVLSYYTMQFVHPKFRQKIIDNIFQALNWGGGFLFFEKVRGIDARFHEMINLAYLEYKTSVGYSNDEIMSKMFSLKGVLEPYSSRENYKFLERAGFKDYTTIYKNLCFEGVLAIK